MNRGIVLVLATAAFASPSAAATRVPRDSWGKPGVSLDQYRADALACTTQGYNRDISQTADAKAFVRGSRELDDATQSGWQPAAGEDPTSALEGYANQFERIRESVDPERRYHSVLALLQATVDRCLVAHGYRRFLLTKAQRRDLARLPIGATARRLYLYKLASDPAVLRDQAEWYVPPAG